MIRKARREDFEFFYTIKCEEDNLYWCGYREKPVRDDLHAFWKRYVSTDKESAVEDTDNMRGAFLHNERREIYIVQEEDRSVGYLYIDYSANAEAELSIAISSKQTGNGYGTGAVQEAVTYLYTAGLTPVAFIREDNNRSEALFERAGLIRTEEYREMILPCGGEQKSVSVKATLSIT